MTDIRELLREATADVAVDELDPVSRIGRATSRRRRASAATVAVVVVVIAAIVAPLTIGRSGSTSPDHPSVRRHAIIQVLQPADGEVAAGFGAIWGLKCCDAITGPSWVDKLDPRTGRRIARVAVPAPTSGIAIGSGRVWVIGANAGGGGPSSISAIDPVSSQLVTMHIADPQAEPYYIAFAAGSAWVTFQLLNQVWRLTPTATGIAKTVVPVAGGPNQIATTGNGAIWVQQLDRNRLIRIIPTPDGGRLGAVTRWPGSIYAAAGSNLLWASRRQQSATELNPGALSHCPPCFAQGNGVRAPGQVVSVLPTARGLYVGTDRGTYFYTFRAVQSDASRPTSALPDDLGGSLVPDGDGVVIGAGDDGLVHWVPAG